MGWNCICMSVLGFITMILSMSGCVYFIKYYDYYELITVTYKFCILTIIFIEIIWNKAYQYHAESI